MTARVPSCLPFPTIAEGCQVMMLRLAEGLGLPPLGPDNSPDYVQAMETARIGGDPAIRLAHEGAFA